MDFVHEINPARKQIVRRSNKTCLDEISEILHCVYLAYIDDLNLNILLTSFTPLCFLYELIIRVNIKDHSFRIHYYHDPELTQIKIVNVHNQLYSHMNLTPTIIKDLLSQCVKFDTNTLTYDIIFNGKKITNTNSIDNSLLNIHDDIKERFLKHIENKKHFDLLRKLYKPTDNIFVTIFKFIKFKL